MSSVDCGSTARQQGRESQAVQQPWEFYNLTVSDLAIVALMIVVFIAALVLPYPDRGKRGKP